MRKIAILSSGSGDSAARLVSLFNEGNRLRVETIVTDSDNSVIQERFAVADVEVLLIPGDKWQGAPGEVMAMLSDRSVELIALDDFRGEMPRELEEAFAGRIISLSGVEEAPREVVAAFARIDDGQSAASPSGSKSMHASECAGGDGASASDSAEGDSAGVLDSAGGDGTGASDLAGGDSAGASDSAGGDGTVPPVPKSVDEEWAATLKMKFDPSQVRPTPPPVPESQTPHVSGMPGQPGVQSGGYKQSGGYNGMQSGGYPGQSPMTAPQREPMPSTYMVLAIIMTIFCCTIPGIVALVFSSQVSSRYAVGDIEGARRSSRNAEIWIIVSFVLGVLSATLYLPVMMIS